MNFKHFYNAAEDRLKESIISLWATGDAEMQKYFTWLLEKEGLLAEPVSNGIPLGAVCTVIRGSLTNL